MTKVGKIVFQWDGERMFKGLKSVGARDREREKKSGCACECLYECRGYLHLDELAKLLVYDSVTSTM